MAILDSPPPSPAVATKPVQMGGLVPEGAPESQTTGVDEAGLMKMGAEIDRAILLMAQAAPAGASDFSQAREFFKNGLAKHLKTATGGSPTEPGTQFPGGGMQHGVPY